MEILLLLSALIIGGSAFYLLRGVSNNTVKLVLVSFFLVATGFFYKIIGKPAAINFDHSVHHAANNQAGPKKFTAEQLSKASSTLEADIKENPSDVQKLTMLANTYALEERYLDSAEIWKRVAELDNKPAYLLRQANMLIAANKGTIPSSANSLVLSTLKQKSDTPEALWLAGLYAAQNNDSVSAKHHWNQLLPLVPTAQKSELQGLITQLNEQLDPPLSFDSEVNTQSDKNLASQLSESDTKVNKPKLENTITINLTISEELKANVADTSTVFIFAKAVGGPPVPLAAKRLTVADLPTLVTLSDADAMMPAFKISDFEKVEVSAKISTSGDAANKQDDIVSDKFLVGKSSTEKHYTIKFK